MTYQLRVKGRQVVVGVVKTGAWLPVELWQRLSEFCQRRNSTKMSVFVVALDEYLRRAEAEDKAVSP